MAITFFGVLKGLLIQNDTDRTKELVVQPSSSAVTSTRMTVESAQTVNRTVTLPDATTTLVGKDTTDILTNKAIDADGPGNNIANIDNGNIKAAAAIDATKLADGSVSNTAYQYIANLSSDAQTQLNAAATDADLSAHEADTTSIHGIADTSALATKTGAESLTNKTIDADLNTLSNIENADIKAGAAIARNKLAVGTASHVLINDGSGVMTSEATLAKSRGGAAADMSSVTFPSTGVIVTRAASEELTNKTITAPYISAADMEFGTASETVRLLVPSGTTAELEAITDNPGSIAFDTDIDKIVYNDGVRWAQLGSGSGGTKNYLGTVNNINGNGDFELGTTTGWTLGITGALTNGLPTVAPTFGSGAHVNLAISAVSSGELAGNYSLSYASSSATTAGNMVASSAFTLDIADQAKVMTVKFAYKAETNPSNANWSGTSSNSFAFAIYDVTNSAWIIPTGAFSMTQSSGVGIATGTFQTSSSGTSYRLVIYNANATSGAVTVFFDDMFVGPQTVPIGYAGTDLENASATTSHFTGLGTVTGIEYESRRDGDCLEIQTKWVSGTTTGAEARVALVYRGVVLTAAGTAKIPSIKIVGKAGRSDAAAVDFVVLAEPNVNYVTFGIQDATRAALTKQLGTGISSSGNSFTFIARVPIAGWSSNVQMSSDTDTRVVRTTVSPSVGASVGANAKIGFNTIVKDSHGTFSTADNRYTVAVSGTYSHTGTLLYGASGALTTATASLYKNGILVKSQYIAVPNGASFGVPFSFQDDAVAGDYYEIFGSNSTAATLSAGSSQWNIERLSGPSVIAANETVSLVYTSTAGTAIPIVGSAVAFTFTTKDHDTHNAFVAGTGIFTAPVSGKYSFSVQYSTYSSTVNSYFLQAKKNGTIFANSVMVRTAAVASHMAPALTRTVSLNAGDTLQFFIGADGAGQNLGGLAEDQFVSIERIGN